MITRHRHGSTFIYRSANGRTVRDARMLDRLRRLAIPPAWTDVEIADDPDAAVQATGRDARGRKQYRYHADWTAEQSRAKFDHLLDFADVLPAIRRGVRRDLAAQPLSRRRVIATLVTLLERTHIRIGNAEYARANGSYGLTTLRNDHVVVRGARLEFRFTGKSGIAHEIRLVDSKIAREVRRCQAVPDTTLFDYIDDRGRSRRITAADVNRYLADLAGMRVTAKDFRTWWGTVAAAIKFHEAPPPSSARAANRVICAVVDEVAAELGNTRAIARKSYIHPAVIERYLSGRMPATAEGSAMDRRGLSADERYALACVGRIRPRRRAAA